MSFYSLLTLPFLFFFPFLFPGSTMALQFELNSTEYPNTHVRPGDWQNQSDSPLYTYVALNVTYVDFYLHEPSVAAIFIASYLLIFLMCMVGNGMVCFIILRSRNMRTVTNLFILNLAISDLLVGIFCMPTTLVDNIITGQWLPSHRKASIFHGAENPKVLNAFTALSATCITEVFMSQ